MTEPHQQNIAVAILMILMHEAAAVPLHAVPEMQLEFLQVQTAITHQILAVQ